MRLTEHQCVRRTSRLLVLTLLPGLTGVFPVAAGCKERAAHTSTQGLTEDTVRRSLLELERQLDERKRKFMALREQVEAIPPHLPGFSDLRTKFYASEEGRGTTDAKRLWLSDELQAAAASGGRVELERVSREIALTYEDLRRIDDVYVKLLHQAMALQRIARQAPQDAST